MERACHHTRPPWDESTNLLAMASSMQAIGLLTSGLQNKSIQWKELYPTVLSCLLWGDQWSGKKLLFHCNNQAVVDIWASGSSQDPLTMHLVYSIFAITLSLTPYPVCRSPRLAISHQQQTRTQPLSPVGINPLANRLAFLQSQAIADSTRRSYQAGIRRYSGFCASRGWQSFPAT